MRVEIMDTTLRDGEQTSGVAYSKVEKLNIAKMLLEEVGVDRIEIASARVSKGEFQTTQKITGWAGENGYLDKIEVLGFIDGITSLEWIREAGGTVLNLLCKGSLRHVRGQLQKSPEEHVADIRKSLAGARKRSIAANVYLEDWSNGMKDSPDYVFQFIDALKDAGISRFMLPDTLGILNPEDTYQYCKTVVDRFPQLTFDFHAHNDYDMAVANCLMAVKAGVAGVHTTVNGLGERTGNAPLASVVAVLRDHLHADMGVKEKKLTRVSRMVEVFSGIRIPVNKPVVGEYVFTQVAGIHADGDQKGNLYHSRLMPERFGRVRKYALGKTSGKASVKKNLEELGLALDSEAMKQVTEKVVELGDRKHTVTTEDLPYIISDVLGTDAVRNNVTIRNYSLCHAHNLRPTSTVSIEINGEIYEESSSGDGQYDAFIKAVAKIYKKLGKKLPLLVDYLVTIPPGGKSDALVEAVITWKGRKNEFKTRGLDSDQTAAAIKATVKMLNLIDG
jgi:D-citramalate synthase